MTEPATQPLPEPYQPATDAECAPPQAPSPKPCEGIESPASSSTTNSKLPAKPYLVGVLYYGGIDREHDKCIQALKGHPYVAAVFEMHGCPYIDIGRSIIATKVLDDAQFGGLLFFDHDMIFEPSEVTKLIESTEACQGVVGAAYSMRRPGHMIGGIDTTGLAPDEKVVFFNGGGPRKATYLGMGMTAIHRSALERLVARADAKFAAQRSLLEVVRSGLWALGSGQQPAEALLSAPENPTQSEPTPSSLVPETAQSPKPKAQLPTQAEFLAQFEEALAQHALPRLKSGISDAPVVPFFSMLQLKDVYFGEDVSFCLRCHDAEIPVQIDTRVRVYHKGSYCYGLEDCGMVVPYCDRLESINAPENTIQNTPFHVPEVQKLLDAQRAEGDRLQVTGHSPDPDTDPDPIPSELSPVTCNLKPRAGTETQTSSIEGAPCA